MALVADSTAGRKKGTTKGPLRQAHCETWGGNIMVWGCVYSKGVGHLCRIDGELYRQILNDEFVATLNWYSLSKEEIVFQQDNDPKHMAKLTTKWFEDNKITLLE
jgi:hypothetical protein